MRSAPVVVIRSNDNCFLDVIRACGQVGISVISVIFTWNSATPWHSEESKFFKETVLIENPATNLQEAANQLRELGQKLYIEYGKCLLIPTSDTSLVFIQQFIEELKLYYLFMGHDCFDKPCLYELDKIYFSEIMKVNQILIPESFSVTSLSDVETIADQITYPCIYKPAIKDLTSSFQNSHNMRKAIECSDKKEFVERISADIRNGYRLLVQELVEFENPEDEVSCYIYADKNGIIRAVSGQHKIMEYPEKYGTGIASKEYYNEQLKEIAIKIVNALKWRGFIGIEFMKNKKTGEWMVIEANLRPWLSFNFQAMCGFNYIQLLYDDAYDSLPVDAHTKTPDRCYFYRINLLGIIRKYIAEGNNKRNVIEKTIQFMKPMVGNMIFSYYISEDILPGLSEKKYIIKKFFGDEKEYEEIYDVIDKNNMLIYNEIYGGNDEK